VLDICKAADGLICGVSILFWIGELERLDGFSAGVSICLSSVSISSSNLAVFSTKYFFSFFLF